MRSLNLQVEGFVFYIIKKLSNRQQSKVVAKQREEIFSFLRSLFCETPNY